MEWRRGEKVCARIDSERTNGLCAMTSVGNDSDGELVRGMAETV